MNLNYNDYHQQKTTCMFIYIHKKVGIVKRFYLKNPDSFQKVGQVALHFYIQKARHLKLCNFSWNFEIVICIQKPWHFLLRDVFIYKKPDTSQKTRQFALRFYMPKTWHFALHNFSWNVWNWRIFIWKKKYFALYFYIQKQCTLRYVFIYKNSDTLRYIFNYKKCSMR